MKSIDPPGQDRQLEPEGGREPPLLLWTVRVHSHLTLAVMIPSDTPEPSRSSTCASGLYSGST